MTTRPARWCMTSAGRMNASSPPRADAEDEEGNQHFATSTHQAPRESEAGKRRRRNGLIGWS